MLYWVCGLILLIFWRWQPNQCAVVDQTVHCLVLQLSVISVCLSFASSFFLYFSNIQLIIRLFCIVVGGWIIVLELYPGFSLYRGLYEFAQYAFNGNYMGTDGMRWGDLSDSNNGMREVFIIMVVEWFLVLLFAYYVDQAVSSGTGKGTFFCLQRFRKKKLSSFRMRSLRRQGSKVSIEMEKPDVGQEVTFSCTLTYILNFHCWFSIWRLSVSRSFRWKHKMSTFCYMIQD